MLDTRALQWTTRQIWPNLLAPVHLPRTRRFLMALAFQTIMFPHKPQNRMQNRERILNRKALSTIRKYFRLVLQLPAMPGIHEPPAMHFLFTQHNDKSTGIDTASQRFLNYAHANTCWRTPKLTHTHGHFGHQPSKLQRHTVHRLLFDYHFLEHHHCHGTILTTD